MQVATVSGVAKTKPREVTLIASTIITNASRPYFVASSISPGSSEHCPKGGVNPVPVHPATQALIP